MRSAIAIPVRRAHVLARRTATTTTRRIMARRSASTSAGDASAKAQAAAAKAGETLQALSAKAGPALMGLLGSLQKMGGRTGRVVGKIETLIPPTKYYLSVARELTKLVYKHREMSPPAIATIQSQFAVYWKSLTKGIPNSALTIQNIKSKVTDVEKIKNTGIIAAEVLGFFTVGEMIGRRKIVGYRGKIETGHH